MEAAGNAAFADIREAFAAELYGSGHVVVVCGPGNNGGDGLVVARLLKSAGVRDVRVVLVGPEEKRSDLFSLQLARCKKSDLHFHEFSSDSEESRSVLKEADLIVDAVFGIGVRGQIETPYRDLISLVNQADGPVVSLDAPSGLDVDRGTKCGVAVRATSTLAFGVAKQGFFVNDGPALAGTVRVLPIGFPIELVREVASHKFLFTKRTASLTLPKRKARTHKSNYGHALVIAGSRGMWGASVLTSTAAYRVGAGYVTLASNENPKELLKRIPEVLTASAEDEKLWKTPRPWTAAAIGPGLGVSEETEALLRRLIGTGAERVVVDADAITVAAKRNLFPLPRTWIITPHAGELARVLGISAQEIEADRFTAVEKATNLTGCVVLLKGFRTLVSHGERTWVIDAGNSTLAKAGTGDVLTGMIVGLLAQGLSPLKAAAAGAYVHGRMADEWVASGRSRSSLVASDLFELIPGLLARLEKVSP